MVPLPRPRRHRHPDRLRALGGARCRGGHTPVLHGADGSVGNSVRASPRWSGWPPSSPARRAGLLRSAPSPPPPAPVSRRAGVSARAERWRTLRCRGAGCRTVFCHLRVLLAGAGLLWGALPRDRATPPRAAVVRQASAQPGRPARSLRPPTGLPREMSPPRDSGTFPPPPRSPTIAAPVRHVGRRPVCHLCGRVWATRAAWRGPPARAGGAHRRKAPDDGNP